MRQSNNKHAKITGALLIAEDTFVQTMEGEEAAVRALFDHIPSGPAPRLVSLLECGDVDIRVFPRWAMAKVAEDGARHPSDRAHRQNLTGCGTHHVQQAILLRGGRAGALRSSVGRP